MRHFNAGPMPSSPMSSRPPLWQVAAAAVGAVAAMSIALYFVSQQHTPIALVGTTLFVGLGGLSFDLARRRAGGR